MIQIDAFLAYSLSAGLALACRKRGAPSRDSADAATEFNGDGADVGNRELGLTVLWLGLTFAPQAVYLMWRFPAWETMFVFPNRDAIPPGLVAGVAASIVGLGALGYWLTYRLLPGRPRLALSLMALSVAIPLCIVTVGWDGRGLQRMLFAGSYDAWAAGGTVSVVEFLRSDLAVTLLWLQSLLLLPYGLMLWRLLRRRAPSHAATAAQPHRMEMQA